jgi:hypothetical protein
VIPVRPHVVIDQPRHDLPLAPPHLDQIEKEAWDVIMRTHDINYAGRILLEMALSSVGRARICRLAVERDGMFITGRGGGLRRHPLLSVEVSSRQLARQIFKMLRIELFNDLTQ